MTRSNAPFAASSSRIASRTAAAVACGSHSSSSVTRWIARSSADRHRVAKLLLGLRRAERQHDGLAAVRLDEPDRLLDAALLVRADREAEVAGLDRLAVVGEDDVPAGHRHALDADEHPHERILVFSGSKIGVAPTTSTVTG